MREAGGAGGGVVMGGFWKKNMQKMLKKLRSLVDNI